MFHLLTVKRLTGLSLAILTLLLTLGFALYPGAESSESSAIPVTFDQTKTFRIGSISIQSPHLNLKVWDNGSFKDGDIVSIYLNNEIIAKNVKLFKEEEAFSLNIEINPSQNNYLLVKSVDEGTLSPSTVSLLVNDNINEERINLVVDSEYNQAFDLNYK